MSVLWSYLSHEWGILSQAPVAFLGLISLCSTIIVGVCRFIFRQQIANLNERIKSRDDDLKRKDELISTYRIRLKEEFPKSIYSYLSNQELKNKVLVFVKELGELIEKYNQEGELIYLNSPEALEYKDNFESQAKIFLDELKFRLPQYSHPAKMHEYIYGNAISLQMIEIVSKDLERLAKSLVCS